MRKYLVGYTGFVGSNLCKQCMFDGLFSSKNIEDAYHKNPDILVYCGIPSQKTLANISREKDKKIIEDAIKNIREINPKKIILISTVDVYDNPIGFNEDDVFTVSQDAYGRNRMILENWVKNNVSDYLIVRLPGLYGENIKKNFIFDLINIVPTMISENKFIELACKAPSIKKFYEKNNDGFYVCKKLNKKDAEFLKQKFKKINFTALQFTDSRGQYQFYNLSHLWNHINIALDNKIKILNVATEPVIIADLYYYIYGTTFKNILLDKKIPKYNFKTKYDYLFGGSNGYILDKKTILKDIKKFVMKEVT